jgi:hypothetical protein
VTLTGSKADDIVVTSPQVDHDDPPAATPEKQWLITMISHCFWLLITVIRNQNRRPS